MAEARAKANSGLMTLVIVVMLLSVVGAGAGFAVGLLLQPNTKHAEQPAPAASETKIAEAHGEPAKSESDSEAGEQSAGEADAATAAQLQLKIIAIPPVVTTLAEPEGRWIRVEGSILVDPANESSPELLAEQSGERVLAYLRTIKLEQLQGPSGFMALKDDLNETVSTLSNGQVRGLIIQGLLVE